MSDRRCSACGEQVPAESETCPRDGVTFAPVSLFGVRMDEPSLVDSVLYERVEHVLSLAPPPAADGFATVATSEEWS